jgi:DNA-binding LacI/PurR family transcriptional regulator
LAAKKNVRPTYAVLAEVAGVSEATVSRVLNGDTSVHPDRIFAVNDAVAKLGYKKHRVASSLASGRTGLIAVVIDDDLSIFSDPFWATVTSGISRVLMANDLQTLLMVSNLDSMEGPVAHSLQSGEVDGAIFFQLHKDALIKRLSKQGLPIVITGTPHTSNDFPFVDTDNFGGGQAATNHLFERGCRTVAIITGDIDTTAGHQRLDGYNQAYRQSGHVPSKKLIARGDYSYESGKARMRELLENVPNLDGVFACNDVMAMGAIAAIEESGKRVPDHVKVVGFDDSVVAQTARPALTSVRQDIVALGETAASLMIAQLRGEDVEPTILRSELIIRETA